ncbi:MAG: hypothetical protein LBR32_11410, partial [Propionibacteriaceae bacterium]|nr:hypothetical protein [Propionibacteriaceae bacterium]
MLTGCAVTSPNGVSGDPAVVFSTPASAGDDQPTTTGADPQTPAASSQTAVGEPGPTQPLDASPAATAGVADPSASATGQASASADPTAAA